MATLNLAGGTLDIVYRDGTRFKFVCHVKDRDGNTVDLSTYTAEMTVRTTRDSSATSLVSLTSAGGDITLTDTNPNVTVDVVSADMAGLIQSGEYDLNLIDADSEPIAFLSGSLTRKRSV